jgi:hypothetical protein
MTVLVPESSATTTLIFCSFFFSWPEANDKGAENASVRIKSNLNNLSMAYGLRI